MAGFSPCSVHGWGGVILRYGRRVWCHSHVETRGAAAATTFTPACRDCYDDDSDVRQPTTPCPPQHLSPPFSHPTSSLPIPFAPPLYHRLPPPHPPTSRPCLPVLTPSVTKQPATLRPPVFHVREAVICRVVSGTTWCR